MDETEENPETSDVTPGEPSAESGPSAPPEVPGESPQARPPPPWYQPVPQQYPHPQQPYWTQYPPPPAWTGPRIQAATPWREWADTDVPPTRPVALGVLALLVGAMFDVLFWRSRPGLSVLLFAVVTVAVLAVTARLEDVRLTRQAILALALVVAFGATSAYRTEPMTVVSSILLAIGLLAVASDSLSSKWFSYGARDLGTAAGTLLGDALSKGVPLATSISRVAEEREDSRSAEKTKAIVRGLLIAAPIFLVLLALLISADAIFADRVKAFFRFFRFGRMPDYAMQMIVIIAVSYMAAGVLVHTLKSRPKTWAETDDDPEDEAGKDPEAGPEDSKSGDDPGDDCKEEDLGIPHARMALGLTESVVILVAVDALFAAFVAIQFRYFFGGNVNVLEGTLTYSEYARRGFAELVVVALMSVILLMTLGAIARRGSGTGQMVFVILRCLLVVLVIVMLVSAFRRLLLYEGAFGFSRPRTYTHVFIVWLAIFMLAVLATQILGRQRAIALGLVWSMIGFCASLSIVNIDAFIARKNVERAQSGRPIDGNYLSGLSTDAVPALFAAFDATDGATHNKIGAALVCIRQRQDPLDGWQSTNLSRTRANALFAERGVELEPYVSFTAAPRQRSRSAMTSTVPSGDEGVRCPEPDL